MQWMMQTSQNDAQTVDLFGFMTSIRRHNADKNKTFLSKF